jgi:hypothetical protein
MKTLKRILLVGSLCLFGATVYAPDAEACDKADKHAAKAKGTTTEASVIPAATTTNETAPAPTAAEEAGCKCGKGDKCACPKEKCGCEACKKPTKMSQADCKCEKGGKNCTCKKGECKCANCGGKRVARGGELALAD